MHSVQVPTHDKCKRCISFRSATKAIRELVGLIRQQATAANPIWMSTHSESVVRQLHLQELMLVDKEDGRTRMKSADSGNITQDNLAPLGLDEAWLSNLLGGGIPW